MKRAEYKTISGRMLDFRETWHVAPLVKAVSQIISEGRVIEAVYGVWCFAVAYPSSLEGHEIADDIDVIALLDPKHKSNLSVGHYAKLYPRFPWSEMSPHWRFRGHGVADCGRWLLAGEYGSPGARLFLLTPDRVRVNSFYETCMGVRHIHAVHMLDEQNFVVTTGDSRKFLDLWSIENGELFFKRRLMSYFGGFTACARVGRDHYFGTDFSSRPNYIYRLRDRKKFYFPRPAFTMCANRFLPVADRFIVCQSRHEVFGGSALTIFDAASERFVRVVEE
jgi:hypothetical protein